MEALLVVLVVLLLCGAAVAALVAVGLVKAARAASARAERVALKARTMTGSGVGAEIARHRLALRDSLDSTRGVLAAAHREDRQVGDAVQLLDRLEQHGRELEGELRLLEREPDRARAGERLHDLAERADRLRGAADQLRWSAQERQHRFADDELTRLTQECADEAEALRHWRGTGAGPTAPPRSPYTQPDPPRRTTAAQGADAGADAGSAATGTAAEEAADAEAARLLADLTKATTPPPEPSR